MYTVWLEGIPRSETSPGKADNWFEKYSSQLDQIKATINEKHLEGFKITLIAWLLNDQAKIIIVWLDSLTTYICKLLSILAFTELSS